MHWPEDKIWYRAPVLKHHPMKGGAKSGREQFSIHYPEDNVTETIDLHKEADAHAGTDAERTSATRDQLHLWREASPAGGLAREVHLSGWGKK